MAIGRTMGSSATSSSLTSGFGEGEGALAWRAWRVVRSSSDSGVENGVGDSALRPFCEASVESLEVELEFDGVRTSDELDSPTL